MSKLKKRITPQQQQDLLEILEARFKKNMMRHKNVDWNDVLKVLLKSGNKEKIWSLHEMEKTGGEPDVTGIDKTTGEYIFMDCSAETPAQRRSLCYDREGLDARKEHKPAGNAVDMAAGMGIELLTEEQYRTLQKTGHFDTKTSSWLKTPTAIRELGGAIFGDFRYGQVFIYHNGAQSYYGSRGFRGTLRI